MPDVAVFSLLFAAPLMGLAALPLLPEGRALLPRLAALIAMLTVLAAAGAIFLGYDAAATPGHWGVNLPWVESLGINLHLAVDGLNIYLLMLTAILFPVVLTCAWGTAHSGNRLFLALLLGLELSLLGTFLSQNLVLFFVFWEAVLIPGSLMILVFGGEHSRAAATTFFLYTLAGSVLLLAAVILLGVESLHQTGSWNFELAALYGLHLNWNSQLFVFCAVVLACAIKCPLFPFHSWLPLAYYEAPFAGTALMSGVLSKMGIFGLLKLALPLCPQVAPAAAPFMMGWAVVSILYGAILALRQEDFKRLLAWSSLSHMGYIVLGVFSFQESALHGALFQVLSHGLAIAGLFLVLSLLEQRVGEGYRRLNALASLAPRLAVLTMLFILTGIALPFTSGFTSEFLILFGAFQKGMAVWQAGLGSVVLGAALLASSGMVLGAGYLLRFGRSILFGGKNGSQSLLDLNLLEMMAFAPLLILILWIGIFPGPLMSKTRLVVSQLSSASGTTPGPKPLSAHVKGAFDGR